MRKVTSSSVATFTTSSIRKQAAHQGRLGLHVVDEVHEGKFCLSIPSGFADMHAAQVIQAMTAEDFKIQA